MKPIVTCLATGLLALCGIASAQDVCLIKVDEAIGPATADYVTRGVDEAQARNAPCLIIELNTPGGLLDSTRTIVQKILASPVPVVVYVAPTGATATSAGCFITLAADIAAMAPTTTIGAAHPVSLDGGKLDDTMKTKLENFSISYIQTLAGRRNRNVDWAASSVRDSASLTAEKALEMKVVEIIAPDLPSLLRQLDGRVIDGHTLRTAQAGIAEIQPSVSEKILQTLWHPEVMFILMLVAIYGIIGELTTPGAILPGVAGAIALVLALYMASILPVNALGLVLIGIALVLFIIDIFAPTHGLLTGGGVISFLIGSMILFDRHDPVFRLPMTYIIPATVITALFFALIAGKGLRAQSLPSKTGPEIMLGRIAPAVTAIDALGGKVFVEGEYWNAVSEAPVQKGNPVEITAIQGLTLTVKPTTQNYGT